MKRSQKLSYSFAAGALLCSLPVFAAVTPPDGTSFESASSHISLDPETQAFLDQVAAAGGQPIYTLTPVAARRVLDDLQSGDVTKLPADIRDETLAIGPTGQVRIRIVRPLGNKEALPVVMWFHGGGWILG